MNKALFNLPVLTTALFSLAATVAITVMVFAGNNQDPITGPTKLIDPMPAPDFKVTDHNGKTITKDSMKGKVWVCDFFLTRCTSICPILGMTMGELAYKLNSDKDYQGVRLISFSVEPEHDSVQVLRAYRETYTSTWSRREDNRRKAIESRWVHARAEDQQAFWALVNDGFKLYVGPSENDTRTPVAHSGKLVLIDRQGNIRGYYDGLSDTDMPALLADIRRLIREEP